MMKGGGDARDWDEDGYSHSILQERDIRTRTVFRTIFAPLLNPNIDPEILVVASSDGTVAPYSISSCISSSNPTYFNTTRQHQPLPDFLLAEPLCSIQGHTGPAYDVKFYGDGDDSLLLSCGDDGHICGWSWKEISNAEMYMPGHERGLKPIFDLVNPQHKGPWEALSPIPENNAIAINTQEGSIFSASGDACAYCWDVETSKRKMVFRGHSDYLHCVVARKSSNQIITGSEDGTARIWDCRSGKCTKVISPAKGFQRNEFSWVSCIDIDASESWLVCGTDRFLTVWSLPSFECIWSIDSRSPVQDVLFDANQILAVGSEPVLTRFNINGMVISQIQCAPQSVFSVSHHPSGVTAVGGYGGLVDVLSEFGSHLCTFCCRGM